MKPKPYQCLPLAHPHPRSCCGVWWSLACGHALNQIDGRSICSHPSFQPFRPRGSNILSESESRLSYVPLYHPGQNTGVGRLSFLQGIFPTQGSNPGLPHCRWILCQQSHKESPRILEWWPISSPVDLPDPGIELRSPALQADSLPTELSGKPT